MIGIDTNVLLRFILADDAAQFEKAKAFVETLTREKPGFVSLLVFAEANWVLRRRYGYGNDVVVETFNQLLSVEELVFEDEAFIDGLINSDISLGGDFSDHIIAHLSARNGCVKTVTFDRNAAKAVPGMELLT